MLRDTNTHTPEHPHRTKFRDTLPTFKRTLNTRVTQGFASATVSFLLFFYFLFLEDSWRITLTLVRKFGVEFIAALYLASNMHEAAFKPLHKKKAKEAGGGKKKSVRGAINFCICAKDPDWAAVWAKFKDFPRLRPAILCICIRSPAEPIVVKIAKLCDAAAAHENRIKINLALV